MKNSKNIIEEFLTLRTLAVVGVSRRKDKFGNVIYRELRARGYQVMAVNPNADMVEGDRCYAGLGALPEIPQGIVLVIPPDQSVKILEEAAAAGIKFVWVQPGADSPEIEKRCQEFGLSAVIGDCLLMFLSPVTSIHRIHRTFRSLTGRLPK